MNILQLKKEAIRKYINYYKEVIPYNTNNLYVLLDGKYNEGIGKYSNTATTWRNLVRNHNATMYNLSNAWGTNYTYGTGGSYGNSGGNGGGSGQGRTTCEFSQGSTSGCNSNVVAYGGGGSTSSSGSAGGGGASGVSGTTNTGGGGGANAAGGSGIVIIRNKR